MQNPRRCQRSMLESLNFSSISLEISDTPPFSRLKNGSQVEAMEDTKLEVLRRGSNTTSRLTINNVRHEW